MELNNTIERECGECGLCCVNLRIEEDDFCKLGGIPCKYLNKEGYGCSVFGKPEKPKVCDKFKCGWLSGMGDENDRPDKSGVFLHIDTFNGGTWIFVMESWKDAHLTTGKNIIIEIANKIKLPIIVSDFESKPGEDFGDYVILRKELESKANQLKGDFICELDKDLNVYKLIISE
jgi:hypothetical protein